MIKYLYRSSYNLLTYLLTPWCRVLLEKLTGLQLVKKLPTFHGTPRFITALTRVHHLSLFWASPIQSIYPHPTSWRSILTIRTLIFTLNVVYSTCSVYSAILISYFYWSHRSLINNQYIYLPLGR